MNKSDKIKEIKRLWNKAEYVLNNKGCNLYGNQLLRLSRNESKSHDNFRSGNIRRGLSITEESKFFAIQRLSAYLYCLDSEPSLLAYHHSQKSVYMAYSLSKEFTKELVEVIKLDDAQYLKELDYCKLIEVSE